MQESVSMHKIPTPVRHSRMNQAMSEEEEKERKRDRKDRGWWKERQPNKTNKAYPGTAQVNKAWILIRDDINSILIRGQERGRARMSRVSSHTDTISEAIHHTFDETMVSKYGELTP